VVAYNCRGTGPYPYQRQPWHLAYTELRAPIISSIPISRGGAAYRFQSLIGNLLNLDVHRSLFSLLISSGLEHQGQAYGHDDENHLRIFPRLHVCLSSSITESNFDTSQVELGVLLDDFGFLVGNGTSTLDEDCHELGDEVFCKSALESLRRR
jgi:hypothetical protein